MTALFTLDYVIHATKREMERQARLKQLTGHKIDARLAQQHGPAITEHKWYLSERLGRDVGLPVAALDYFENVRPAAAPRPKTRLWRRWQYTLRPILLGY